MKRNIRNTLVVTVAGLLVAACSSDGGEPIVPPPASVKIDSANAALVAKLSYEAALDSAELGELEGSIGTVASGPAGVSKIDSAFRAAAKTGNSGSNVPIPAETVMCAVDGSVTMSGEIADPVTPTLTEGDFFEFDFDMCDDGTGEVTDGLLRADVDSFSGEFGTELFNLGMTFSLTMLQVTSGQDVRTSNGDASVDIDTLNLPFIATGISGVSMTIDGNASSETLTDYSTDLTFDGNLFPAPYTMTAGGTLESTELTGVIRYSTLLRFEGLGGDYPHVGELLVEGDSSGLRLVAENNVDVTIHIDTNGDGTFDGQVITTTWAELLN